MKKQLFFFPLLIVILWTCQSSPDVPDGPLAETKAMLSPDERYAALFEAIQMTPLFSDSKIFADANPKQSTDEILKAYELNRSAPDFDLAAFVDTHFTIPQKPRSRFKSDTARSVVQHIHQLWPVLTRRPDAETTGTLLPLPHPHLLSSGSAREVYYWESYFAMLGLKAAGQEEMIENMINNFSYLMKEFGFIPNGNRRYLQSRSQAPFFAAMIDLLAAIKGEPIYSKYLSALEKEYEFWMSGRFQLNPEQPTLKRVVRMPDGALLNRYFDDRSLPRPEAYLEDIKLAKGLRRNSRRVHEDIRAACESGWKFSSRWFSDGQYMASIQTTSIIPVDLNALLFHMEMTLAKSYGINGNEEQKEVYLQRAENRKRAIEKYCWDEQKAVFLDYSFVNRQQTKVPSLAMLYPLYFNMATQAQADTIATFVQNNFLKAGGLLTSLNQTGQDWDAPFGWAPLQWISIQGLRNYGHMELADTIKQRWVDLNVRVYQSTGKLLEKYNVVDMTLEDGGGQYPFSDGYAWTNAVLLGLLSEERQE